MWLQEESIYLDVYMVVGDEFTAECIEITPAGQNGHYQEGHTRPRPSFHLLPQRTNQEGLRETLQGTITY